MGAYILGHIHVGKCTCILQVYTVMTGMWKCVTVCWQTLGQAQEYGCSPPPTSQTMLPVYNACWL